MNNLRKYGKAPFSVAVIHGGPGVPGEMAQVAKELSITYGVLEPLQTKASIEGQLQELYAILKKNGDFPVAMIGWSWGAWLSFIFAARYPALLKKLILISSGPYEEKYAADIMKTRLNRLNREERAEALNLIETLKGSSVDNSIKDKNLTMARFGKLIYKADSYNSVNNENESTEYQSNVQVDIYLYVWKQASELRSSGKLLEFGKKIQCPVVAIHGDYDPHPAEGVKKPLSRVLKDFQFILLENCGHHPWLENAAKDRFYKILREELI